MTADQPVGYWRLGEASSTSPAADASGYNDDGAYSGYMAGGQPGAIGNANGEVDTAIYSGGGGSMTVANADPINPSPALTVEAWIHPITSSYTGFPVVKKAGQYELDLNPSGGWVFKVWVRGQVYAVSKGTVTIPASPVAGWFHVVGTFDGQTVSIYLNGVLAGSTTLTSVQAGPADTGLSSLVAGGDGTHDVEVDELALYASALTQTQIQAHFAAAGVGCVNIAGATSATYTLAAADSASRLRVVVTASSDSGSTSASSADTAVVTNPRPRVLTAPAVVGTPVIGGSVTADAGSWSGGSSFSYQWQRCSSYSESVAADNPQGYWRLGEAAGSATATDSSGYGNDGTYSGPFSYSQPGAIGAANGELDTSILGTGSVTVPDAAVLTPARRTIEAWVEPINYIYSPITVISKPGEYQLQQSSSGYWVFTMWTPGKTYTAGAVPTPSALPRSPVSGWWHMVATFDGTTMRVYYNGVLVASTTGVTRTPPVTENRGPLVMSGNQPAAVSVGLDEVALYSSALSQARIQAHFAAAEVGCKDITGATDQSYAPSLADAGARLRVRVTTSNTVGAISRTSGETGLTGWAFPGSPPQSTYDDAGGVNAIDPSAGWNGVDTATGAYSTSATDASLAGIGVPFAFTRTYVSANSAGGRFGPGWSDGYSDRLSVSSSGDVALYSDSGGQLVTLHKQADGSYLAANGSLCTLTTITGGYEAVRQDQTHLRFDTQGRLTSMRDRNGQGLAFSYDSSGNLTTITDSAGRVIVVASNADGTISKLTLPDGRNVQYTYTGGRLTGVTDLGGGQTTYQYDASGLLSQITDANGHTVVQNTYDANTGRVLTQTDGLGNQTTFAWDGPTQTATITDPRGHVTKDVYADNVLQKTIDRQGHTTRYAYDANLNVAGVTDARGNTTTMTYDARHNMLTRDAPSPLSYHESWTYDAKNNPLTYTDGRGNTTSYAYDGNGNLTSKTEPGTIVTQYGRDPAGTGLLVSLTDPRGKTATYGYDSADNLTSVTTPSGAITTMGYDSSGRLTSRVDPRGNVTGANPNDYKTTYVYDALDRKTSETDPLGDQQHWTYDAVGNLLSATDANSNVTTYAYDADNDLASVTAPGTVTTSYAYDANGNLTQRTDANNHITTYGYDEENRLQTVTTPLNTTWQYGYDASGNRTTTISPRGTTTSTYDELNRLKTVGYSDSTPSVSYSYDADNNRTQMVDGAGTATYAYDVLNRLSSATRGTDAFSYSYDPAGNLTERTYPGGTTTDYTYDDDGNLASVASSGATTTYSYDPASELISTTRPSTNGWNESRTYDHAGRLTEIRDANPTDTLQRLDYGYDANGNETSLTRLNGSENYEYNNRNRLTKVCYDAACASASDYIAWTYDGVGNRLTEVRPTGTTSYTYNPGDQLTQTSGPGGTTTYGYDGDGNETSAGSTTYTYDLADRLSGATIGSASTTYTYDGDANRLSQTSGSATTSLLWDINGVLGLPQLALERDSTGTEIRKYLQGRNGVAAMVEGGATYYLHADRLGSVTAVTASDGTKEWSYTYEPFGTPRTVTKVDPNAPVNPLGYVGQYTDPQTALLDLRARQYDSTTGRFLSIDPSPLGATNPDEAAYDYVNDDPVNATDLNGEMCWGCVLPAIGSGLAADARFFAWAGTRGAPTVARPAAGVAADMGAVALLVLSLGGDDSTAQRTTGVMAKNKADEGPHTEHENHFPDFNTKKKAKEAAQRDGDGPPINHPDDPHGPHYHANDGTGKPVKSPNIHYKYPKRRGG